MEQIKIVIRFLDKHSIYLKKREEFSKILPLDQLNAELVSTKILSYMVNH